MIYKWHKEYGLIDAATERQVLQILPSNCTKKFRNMAGKELAERLNVIERSKRLRARKRG